MIPESRVPLLHNADFDGNDEVLDWGTSPSTELGSTIRNENTAVEDSHFLTTLLPELFLPFLLQCAKIDDNISLPDNFLKFAERY